MSLARRIWLLVVGVVVMAACLTAGIAWWSAQAIVLNEVDADLRYEAERFAFGRSDRDAPRSGPGLGRMTTGVRDGLEWRIVFAQGNEPERHSEHWPAVASELSTFDSITPLSDNGQRWRAIQLRVEREDLEERDISPPSEDASERAHRRWERRMQLLQRREAALQGAVIQVAVEVSDLHAELRRLAWLLASVVAGVSVLALVVAGTLRDAVLAPLARLSRELTRLDDASLSARVQADPLPPELLQLQERINALLQRLSLVRQQERRTLANMAHELRTPLAAMASALSFARDDADRRRVVSDMQEQVGVLARRCDALLMLSRADAGAISLRCQALGVSELLADAWASLAAMQADGKYRLDVIDEQGAEILADPHFAPMVLENILRNAMHHGSQPNYIAVRVQECEHPGFCRIICENPITEGTPGEREEYFQPFWRADASRHNSQQHAGLGLALVARLMALHGGRCQAAVSDDGQRFTITLEWPRPAGE